MEYDDLTYNGSDGTLTEVPELVVLYHKNCMDGLFAAAVVALKYRESDIEKRFIACQYGDEVPDIKDNARVYCVDFSFKRDQLLALEKRTFLSVYDHHKSTEEELGWLPFFEFDLHECGASLTWLNLFKGEPVPEVIQYVRDRDLWLWEMKHSRDISAGLKVMIATVEDALALLMDDDLFPVLKAGYWIRKYQQQVVSQMCKHAQVVEVGKLTYALVNTPVLQSEVGETLVQTGAVNVAAMYCYMNGGDVLVSLRSNNAKADAPDVARIAQHYGGGGHKHAAGFRLGAEEFGKLFLQQQKDELQAEADYGR